ncbi:MAG: sugar phosphate isomerase/epimerase, partial [Moraxellaceae bacterium]
MNENNFPKLHNATWPGIVGKGPDSEPPISFDTMLAMTAAAEVDGIKFDGIDIGLLEPHVDINGGDDEIKRLADKVGVLNLNIGSLVAPIWGGPAMGSKE